MACGWSPDGCQSLTTSKGWTVRVSSPAARTPTKVRRGSDKGGMRENYRWTYRHQQGVERH
jgi:hypothetical protein